MDAGPHIFQPLLFFHVVFWFNRLQIKTESEPMTWMPSMPGPGWAPRCPSRPIGSAGGVRKLRGSQTQEFVQKLWYFLDQKSWKILGWERVISYVSRHFFQTDRIQSWLSSNPTRFFFAHAATPPAAESADAAAGEAGRFNWIRFPHRCSRLKVIGSSPIFSPCHLTPRNHWCVSSNGHLRSIKRVLSSEMLA